MKTVIFYFSYFKKKLPTNEDKNITFWFRYPSVNNIAFNKNTLEIGSIRAVVIICIRHNAGKYC